MAALQRRSVIVENGTRNASLRRKSRVSRPTGTTISTQLLQRPTNSQKGPDAVIHGRVEAINDFLAQNEAGCRFGRGLDDDFYKSNSSKSLV